MYICVTGNIGAGKSTLVERLSKDLHLNILSEPVDDNPYLEKFYADPKPNALRLQLFLHYYRFTQLYKVRQEPATPVISDRCIFDQLIFSKMMIEDGMLEQSEFDLFWKLYDDMRPLIDRPDMTIYIRNSVDNLMDRIHTRGRECEKGIPREYIKRLNDKYDDFLVYTKSIDAVKDMSNLIVVEDYDLDKDYDKILSMISSFITNKTLLNIDDVNEYNRFANELSVIMFDSEEYLIARYDSDIISNVLLLKEYMSLGFVKPDAIMSIMGEYNIKYKHLNQYLIDSGIIYDMKYKKSYKGRTLDVRDVNLDALRKVYDSIKKII
jgi:deoxyadenosine/deoxycytidine kinase